MILKEKKIVLKNGVTALLKTPEIRDAEKLLDCIKTICGETNFLARYYSLAKQEEILLLEQKVLIL